MKNGETLHKLSMDNDKFLNIVNSLAKKLNLAIARLTDNLRNKIKIQAILSKPYGKSVAVGFVIVIVVILLAGIFTGIHDHNRTTKLVANKLNAIDNQANQVDMLYHDITQLTQIINNNNHLTQNEIGQLGQQVQAIQARAQQLSDQNDIKQISQSLNQSNQLLTQKIASLESNVNDVKQVLQPHDFIDPKNLPFKVISIDIWDGTPYATVQIDNQQALMGINESRAGWIVDSMDFATRQIIFRNNKDQYTKIQLEN